MYGVKSKLKIEKKEDVEETNMTKKKKLTISSRDFRPVHNADSFDRLVKLVNIASVHMGAREVLDVDGWTNVIRAADLDLDASDARRLYTWIQSTEGRKKNVLGKRDILSFLRRTRYARSISRGVEVQVYMNDKWVEGTVATLLRSTAGGGIYDISCKKTTDSKRTLDFEYVSRILLFEQ